MNFVMSDHPQTLVVYNFSADTNEYTGKTTVVIPSHTGLPVNTTLIAPSSAPAGFVSVYDAKKNTWVKVVDHRGITVFDIDTGKPTMVSELGPLPEGTVTKGPTGDYQKWNGEQWVKDIQAERTALIKIAESQKSIEIRRASEIIATLLDAVEMELATDVEKDALADWKKYRIWVNRIDPENAPDIIWPEVPHVA